MLSLRNISFFVLLTIKYDTVYEREMKWIIQAVNLKLRNFKSEIRN